jgi:hypothetical protein
MRIVSTSAAVVLVSLPCLASEARQPLEKRSPGVLIRAARMSETKSKQMAQGRWASWAKVWRLNDEVRKNVWYGGGGQSGDATRINETLATIPGVNGVKVGMPRRRGLASRRLTTLSSWKQTLEGAMSALARPSQAEARLASNGVRFSRALHQRMDSAYQELPKTLDGKTDAELSSRATQLIAILDNQSGKRLFSSQSVGRGLSQLLPAGTAYTFDVSLPGLSSRAPQRGIPRVEARHITQLGLELHLISRILTRRQHRDAASLAAWVKNSSISFETHDMTKLSQLAAGSYGSPGKGLVGRIELARAPADVRNPELLRLGVVSRRLATGTPPKLPGEDSVTRIGAGANY